MSHTIRELTSIHETRVAVPSRAPERGDIIAVGGRIARFGAWVTVAAILFGGGVGALTGLPTVISATALTGGQPDQEHGNQQGKPHGSKGKPGSSSAPLASPTANPVVPTMAEDRSGTVGRVATYVEKVEPTGDAVPVNAPILLSFSQPMERASVEQSFALRPAAEGQLIWADDFTLRFQAHRLAHSVTYELQVGGRSVRGVHLRGQHQWRFTTVALPPVAFSPTAITGSENPPSALAKGATYVEKIEPSGDAVSVNIAIAITFSQPMMRASVEQSFALWPAAAGQLSWTDDFTFRFLPYRLAHGVTYEVQVRGRSVHGVPLKGQHEWRFTTVALPPIALNPGPSAITVPILMYHYVRVVTDPNDGMGFRLSVTPADFAAQMDWLAANGYHPITLEDLNAYLSGTRGLPSKPVILSFDDGYADFYTTALPILRAHDFAAVAYVVSGFIGQPGYMSADQVLEANRVWGIEIGSHTVNHVNLTTQSVDGLVYQLTASKQALEALLGHPVLSFCYPSGRFNSGVVAAVRSAGYRDATTTQAGFPHTMADRYTWGRLRISGGGSLGSFVWAVASAS